MEGVIYQAKPRFSEILNLVHVFRMQVWSRIDISCGRTRDLAFEARLFRFLSSVHW